MKRLLALFLSLAMLSLAACSEDNTPKAPQKAQSRGAGATLTVMTHDSFNMSEAVLDGFQQQTGITVKFLKSGSTGAALNQAILAKGNPLADVFVGVDTTFLSRAIDADIFIPFESAGLRNIPKTLRQDKKSRLTPISFGDVCLNYDKKWFLDKGLTPPASLEDLILPQYKDLLVVENPATSSPGLSFLLATVAHFGEDGYIGYWKALAENGVKITDSWKKAYWGEFSAASDGTRPIVVSYASSPAAEVHFAEEKPHDAPTAAVLTPGSGFRQVEFAGILDGTKHLAEAQQFIDFLLSKSFQEDIPLQMWVYPASTEAILPDEFSKYAQPLREPANLDPQKIAQKREKWIEMWTATVLR
ncbi:thiamine ABC transporter substrate-binding protein [Desulfobaculum bizertense]|uniref:Thiamine transport system substrate-binding protein n=1 Tax=Desulfobaculum bizertense DSM 18034 TaxID=1121442 RepID=A0A1T4VSX0_9BACT|nr:thiamine ABC transporter substrate-binding protein [Desulfobaculum bizertense]SKA68080.1 thiamine transport system substrate-binding protein [Desulfobaculum bizertense DSM 18034]